MGGQCSGENFEGEYSFIDLTVVTLSYCGLTSSPFEFYINEYQHQLERIGGYFQDMIKIELPDFCNQQKSRGVFGNIELMFKKRYSPMFDKMAGIIKNKEDITNYKIYRFVTEKQFEEKWQQKYKDYYQKDEKFRKQVKKMQIQNKLQACKQNVRRYDFLMFRALLRYVYKKEKFGDVVNENPNKYINIISPLFEFSFLDQANKLSKFQYGFRKTNPDVYFLQETTKELLNFLEKRAKRNYRWIGDEDGQLILIKKQKFAGQEFEVVDLDDVFKLKQPTGKGTDRITKPIALGTVSKRFLFVSLHFSSRKEVNQKQIQYLKDQLLVKIKQKKLYECVVLGGNLNKFQDQFPGYNFYPKKPTQITTFKKRTKTQAQIAKNDIRDKRSLDKIITDQTIKEGLITLIDGTKPDQYSDDEAKKQKNKDQQKDNKEERVKCKQGLDSKIKMMLPCEIHPFDKFLVKTIIQAKYKNHQNHQNSIRQN